MFRIFCLSGFLWLVLCSGVKSPEFTLKSYPKVDNLIERDLLDKWWILDPIKDKTPGISLARAYSFLKGKKNERVVVAVIGSGININHPDLKNVIWTNPGEISNNGKDDDGNGFPDDIHGWNFLGETVYENREVTRMVRLYKDKFENKSVLDVSSEDLEHYLMYKRSREIYENGLDRAAQDTISIGSLKRLYYHALHIIDQEMGEDYTEEELLDKVSFNMEFLVNRQILYNLLEEFDIFSLSKAYKMERFFETESIEMKYYYNQKYFSDRSKMVTASDYFYGNSDVVGPKKSESFYGTYLSGLIVNSGFKVPSVAQNALIMPIRVVPNGDEYDEDVALGIRYAVDNGAKVIVIGFTKPVSPKRKLVEEAIKYAEEKDVFIVMTPGDDRLDKDLSQNVTFPKDYDQQGKEFVSNVLTVGASGFRKKSIVEKYSSYGSKNVDIFAPGDGVLSLSYGRRYSIEGSGTLAATAITAGVVAMLRSYYPTLSSKAIKKVIMDSGMKSDLEVETPFKKGSKRPFSNLSKSGKILNFYRALLFAEQRISKQSK